MAFFRKKRLWWIALWVGFCAAVQAAEVKDPEVPEAIHSEKGWEENPSDKVKKAVKRTRGFFGTIGYLLNDLDTNYVSPNRYNFTVMVENSLWHEYYHLADAEKAISFTPSIQYKIGPYIGWSFLFLGWSFDIRALLGQGNGEKRTEFSLNLYSSIVGGDLYFRKSGSAFRLHDLEGFGEKFDEEFDEEVNGFSVDIKGADVYYVFNHRRFSYPAAYSQSTNQKRSAGSFIAGLSFSDHNLKLDDGLLPKPIRDSLVGRPLDFEEIHYSDYSISFGYAYNWVFARNCLLNVSLTPAVAYKESRLESEEQRTFTFRKVNFDFIARAALTWNNGKYYVGASWVYNDFNYRTEHFNLRNGFGIARLYTGFNFGLKKKYRRSQRL